MSQLLTQIQDRTKRIPCQREDVKIPKQRAALERPRNALPRFLVTSKHVFERLLEKNELPLSSTIQRILAPSSQELRPDTAGNAKRLESEIRRETRNSSIPAPRFQSGSGLLNHTGGTYSHGGMMDYTRFPISEVPHIIMHWSKEVEIAKSIDKLVTSR